MNEQMILVIIVLVCAILIRYNMPHNVNAVPEQSCSEVSVSPLILDHNQTGGGHHRTSISRSSGPSQRTSYLPPTPIRPTHPKPPKPGRPRYPRPPQPRAPIKY